MGKIAVFQMYILAIRGAYRPRAYTDEPADDDFDYELSDDYLTALATINDPEDPNAIS